MNNITWGTKVRIYDREGEHLITGNFLEYKDDKYWIDCEGREYAYLSVTYDICKDTENRVKTTSIQIDNIKDSDGWASLAYDLKYKAFAEAHPGMHEDDISELFYIEVISKTFEYGEFANIEIEVDEKFNIVGGKILEHKK